MTRAERRRRRRKFIARRQRIMRGWYDWGQPETNRAWRKCAKYNFAHGCALCHFAKYDRKSRRKRRRALDAEIAFSIEAWRE